MEKYIWRHIGYTAITVDTVNSSTTPGVGIRSWRPSPRYKWEVAFTVNSPDLHALNRGNKSCKSNVFNEDVTRPFQCIRLRYEP